MGKDDVNNIDMTNNKAEEELIRRHISVYLLHCEGQRYDEIAEALGISKSTVRNDIRWCRENLPAGFGEELRDDIIFDTIRRRAILWSRFKKLAKIDTAANHLVRVSNHILELDKKILEWKGVVKNSLKVEHSLEKKSLEDILSSLEEALQRMPDKELAEIAEDKKLSNR